MYTRRNFIRTTAAAAITAPFIVKSSAIAGLGHVAPSDKINIGIIGCGPMGTANLNTCASSEKAVITAACDVWKERLDRTVAQHANCKGYSNYHDLLNHGGVDGVIISTPAHWHAIQAIDAAKAGKHIYLQKPMAMHFAESVAIRNAVRRHKVICQIGTQIHASDHYRRMVELVRSGNLGHIATVRTFFVMNSAPDGIGSGFNTDKVPEGLNWNEWVGPARMQPFNPNLVKEAYYHCFWMDFSGGWTPGMAPHITDLPIWAMNLDYPTEISSTGGRYVLKDDSDAYDNQEILWRYPNMTMTWMFSATNSHGWAFHNADRSGLGYETGMQRRLGIYFHGENGTLMTDYSSHILVPEGNKMDGMQTPPQSIPSSPGQELEWIDCIKSGQQPLCNPEYHVKVDVPVVLSLLSMKLGRSIRFDPQTEKIVDDKEATRLAMPEYRAPYKLPKEYL
ncbi:MAG: Gfo/Idh/MocA family oxidoreductase [Tannerella sp.]|jgi:predicted dehydrogenase|nr:Gfo/Idh/MocA family oxidoreductase [Tannerella sp.]